MQPFGLTNYVKPSNLRQNTSVLKLMEITAKAGTPE
jgi:hypothetical protein